MHVSKLRSMEMKAREAEKNICSDEDRWKFATITNKWANAWYFTQLDLVTCKNIDDMKNVVLVSGIGKKVCITKLLKDLRIFEKTCWKYKIRYLFWCSQEIDCDLWDEFCNGEDWTWVLSIFWLKVTKTIAIGRWRALWISFITPNMWKAECQCP